MNLHKEKHLSNSWASYYLYPSILRAFCGLTSKSMAAPDHDRSSEKVLYTVGTTLETK